MDFLKESFEVSNEVVEVADEEVVVNRVLFSDDEEVKRAMNRLEGLYYVTHVDGPLDAPILPTITPEVKNEIHRLQEQLDPPLTSPTSTMQTPESANKEKGFQSVDQPTLHKRSNSYNSEESDDVESVTPAPIQKAIPLTQEASHFSFMSLMSGFTDGPDALSFKDLWDAAMDAVEQLAEDGGLIDRDDGTEDGHVVESLKRVLLKHSVDEDLIDQIAHDVETVARRRREKGSFDSLSLETKEIEIPSLSGVVEKHDVTVDINCSEFGTEMQYKPPASSSTPTTAGTEDLDHLLDSPMKPKRVSFHSTVVRDTEGKIDWDNYDSPDKSIALSACNSHNVMGDTLFLEDDEEDTKSKKKKVLRRMFRRRKSKKKGTFSTSLD